MSDPLDNGPVAALTAERYRLKADVARLEAALAERDRRISQLESLLNDYLGFSREELQDLEKNGVPLSCQYRVWPLPSSTR